MPVDPDGEENGFHAACECLADEVRVEGVAFDDGDAFPHVTRKLRWRADESGHIVLSFQRLYEAFAAERSGGSEEGDLHGH